MYILLNYYFFPFYYLKILSVSRLCSVSDRTIHGYGAIGGMRIGRGSRHTPEKPVLVPFCPPSMWDQIWATAMGSWQLNT
jgi:hypothetical protein